MLEKAELTQRFQKKLTGDADTLAREDDDPMLIEGVWLSPSMFKDIAKLTGASIRSVRRWYQYRRLPVGVGALIRFVYHGDLGAVHPAFAGWRIKRDGVMYSPDGPKVPGWTPGHLRAAAYRFHELAELKRENIRLREQLELAFGVRLVGARRALNDGIERFESAAGGRRLNVENQADDLSRRHRVLGSRVRLG